MLLLEKGVSPTQATNLNVPPPIDTISELQNNVDSGLFDSNSALNILSGSDLELDSLVLDDLVLANLLGNRRSDSGESGDNLSFLKQLLGQSKSQTLNPLPSSLAAPVQPQPLTNLRRRKNRPKRRKKSDNNAGGGGSLCQIMNICDSVPSATQEQPTKSQTSPHHDVPFASSQQHQLIVEAPPPDDKDKRMGEKTAAEVAALFAGTYKDQSYDDEPMDSETIEDTHYGGSSVTNTFAIHDYEPAMNFSDGRNVLVFESPEEYKMSNYGEDANDQRVEGNRPITFINFEQYNEERQSKMIDDDSDNLNIEELAPPSAAADDDAQEVRKDFKLQNYNLDSDAKTWRPLRKMESGELERTDVSETLDESEWVPKLGPSMNMRET